MDGLGQPGTRQSRHRQALALQTSGDASQYIETGEHQHWWEFLTNIVPDRLFGSFVEGKILQVIFLAVVFGIAIKLVGKTGEPIIAASAPNTPATRPGRPRAPRYHESSRSPPVPCYQPNHRGTTGPLPPRSGPYAGQLPTLNPSDRHPCCSEGCTACTTSRRRTSWDQDAPRPDTTPCPRL
ncbi:cation:dicarboxylate symporter family transporter [Streptomyces sp. ID05-47C]|uniref:cation:dicarboxylate symporter family transporter n=1 Tax=Streptomyces sp. ID05-47C TaxID=3028665 RepID=UPI0029B88E2A|nr:cation:dicarboxylase symporter family transporter [Streptomyces sp. ID05-47C]MDX3569324.1 cation:dicarboxylase symporter family transporter [Streptomyces sp. ID05-47C]